MTRENEDPRVKPEPRDLRARRESEASADSQDRTVRSGSEDPRVLLADPAQMDPRVTAVSPALMDNPEPLDQQVRTF